MSLVILQVMLFVIAVPFRTCSTRRHDRRSIGQDDQRLRQASRAEIQLLERRLGTRQLGEGRRDEGLDTGYRNEHGMSGTHLTDLTYGIHKTRAILMNVSLVIFSRKLLNPSFGRLLKSDRE